MTAFHHGVEVTEVDDGERPLRTLATGIIGLGGTAPGQWTAAGLATDNAINEAVLLRSRADGAKHFGSGIGTIPDALDAIYGQGVSPPIAVVNVLDPASHKVAVARKSYALASGKATLDHKYVRNAVVLGPPTAQTAADATLVGSVVTIGSAGQYITDLVVENGAQNTVYMEGTDYTFSPDTRVLTRLSGGSIGATDTVKVTYNHGTRYIAGTDYTLDAVKGTITRTTTGSSIASATATLRITYDRLDTAAVTVVQVGGVADPGDGAATGANALAAAPSVVRVKPKILIAPGYSDEQTVATALLSVARTLKAIVVAEGPDTADSAAVTYRENFDDRRLYLVDPGVQVTDEDDDIVSRPNSAYVAGVIARSDSERGYWWSPSNRPILGISGTTRPVDYVLDDTNSRANHLNENEIATIIRESGWRLWGNRTCSSDAKYAFLSVVRIADALDEALLTSHLWAVDRNITRTYLEDVAGGVNAYIRELIGLGAVLGGSCVPSPDLNTKTSIAAGRVYFDVDFTPTSPAERITFRRHLTNDYIEEILQ